MKNKKERTLAYQLSTLLEQKELEQVSGGGAQMTTRQTVRISGDVSPGADLIYDFGADW